MALSIAIAAASGGCGADTTRQELAGVPLSDELRPLVEDARHALKDPDTGDASVKRDLDMFVDLQQSLYVPDTRAGAADRILAEWREHPGHFLWPELAVRNKSLLPRKADLDSMFAYPALADTTTAVGLYMSGWRTVFYANDGGDIRRARELRDTLDPLQRFWLDLKTAWIERLAGNAAAATRLALGALPAARELGGHRAEMFVWIEAARALKQGNRLDDALHAVILAEDLAVSASAENGNVYQVLNAHLLHADVLASRREKAAALDLYVACADTALALDMLFVAAKGLNRAGILTSATGDFELGLRLYHQSLAIALADRDSLNIPKHLMNLARRHNLLGRLDSCLVYQRRAERWVEAYPNSSLRARMPLMQAEYYAQIGDYATVDSLFTAAVNMKPNQTTVQALAEFHLRFIKEGVERGRPELAYRSFSVLDSLRGRLGDSLADRHVTLDLDLYNAAFLTRQGRFAQATAALARAAEALERKDDPDRRWKLERTRGTLARRRGDLRSAENAFNTCLALSERIGNPDRISSSRFLLGSVLMERERYEDARRLFPDRADDGSAFRTLLSSLLLRGMSFSCEGRYDDALATLDRARQSCSPWSPPDLVAAIDLETGRALAGAGRSDEAHQRYRSVQDILETLAATRRSDVEELFDGDLRRDLAEAVLSLAVAADNRTVTGDEAVRALARAREIIPGWKRRADTMSQSLRRPQLIFFVGRQASFRWSVSEDDVRLTRLPGERRLTERLAPVLADLAQPGRSLVPHEMQTMMEALGGAPTTWPADDTLVIVPDGALHAIPWAALPWPGIDGATWLDRGPLVVMAAPATGSDDMGRLRPGGRLLALGVDGSAQAEAAGLSMLHHAEREAREVHDRWPEGLADLRTGRDAAGGGIATHELATYDAIHVASHAVVYRGSPQQTSLLLAGTVATPLTAEQIRELELDADLIFLSCCEAAEGYARIAGPAHAELARSFLDAGARVVVAPIVRIDDEAARLLAGRFYDHWLSGMTVAAALRKAQLELRDGDPRWAHYLFWSSHISIYGSSDASGMSPTSQSEK